MHYIQYLQTGFVIGLVSIVLWIIPMVPQLLENYRRKSCEGLSIWFLLFWILGDTSNLIGAFLAKQLPVRGRCCCFLERLLFRFKSTSLFIMSLPIYFYYHSSPIIRTEEQSTNAAVPAGCTR